MFPYLPIPRRYKPGEKATLEDLKLARQIAAKIVAIEPATLPIFQRLDREIIAIEKDMADIERAKLIAKNGLHFEYHNELPF